MSVELIMPKAGLTNTEGTISSWKAQEGVPVKKGDVILEIENEKTTMEFESPADGILHITAPMGTEVLVGGVMGYLAQNKEEYESLKNNNGIKEEKVADERPAHVTEIVETANPVIRAAGGRVKASPLAKALASKAGIDISRISGTGPGGRIVSKDIEQYKLTVGSIKTVSATSEPIGREPVRIPLTPMRKAIGKRMYESLQSMAQTSVNVELDVTDLVKLRTKLALKEEEFGTKITINDLCTMACIKMLAKHPLANAELTDAEIITYPYVNLSMAVATDFGLTSPVVKNANNLSLIELSKALKSIAQKARANKLTMDDLTGGTFTVTNMGIFPLDTFGPIVNPPQSAIVGFGRCAEKPAVFNGEITIRTMMFLSITYDHRVFDGSEVGLILRDMKEYLENPELILL